MIQLMLGDCLEKMKEIPDGSVDMILTDPPYGTMKGAEKTNKYGSRDSPRHEWDNTIEHSSMLAECNRVLRTNGALLLFSQDPYTAKLMTDTHGNMPFSYRLTWLKDNFAFALLAKKAPVNYTEDICVFFKKHTKHDFEGFHPLRPYAKKVCEFISKGKKEIFSDMGHQGICHFMRHDSTQFNLCTNDTYNQLIELYKINRMEGFVEYSELKPVDRDYRDKLIERMNSASPRRFNLWDGKKYKSNVLQYKKDRTGHHPTQKPVALMEDLIKTYTNEGETVLDFTMGSGTTGVACKNLNRRFIGIELDEEYFKIAQERIEKAQADKAMDLFGIGP